jgi:putative phage-type endonuclease
MSYILKSENISDEEFRNLRSKGIGGSDVAAILGLNSYKTIRQVYYDKIDPQGNAKEINESMESGIFLESGIADWYAHRTGYKIIKDNKVRIHKDYPFLLANLDRIAILPDGSRRVVEIKNTGTWAYQNWGGEVPLPYFCQVQHYMGITGYDTADFAIVKDGKKLEIYTVKRDDEFLSLVIPKLVNFWNENVLKGIPPEPSTSEEVRSVYTKHIEGKYLEADENLFETVKQLKKVKEDAKEIKKLEESLEVKIQNQMQDAESLLYSGSTVATWKTQKASFVIDGENLAKDEPEIFKKYLKPKKSSRTFLIKI